MDWKEELSGLIERCINSKEELSISGFIEKNASPEFLAMSNKEHKRLETLHARGIYE